MLSVQLVRRSWLCNTPQLLASLSKLRTHLPLLRPSVAGHQLSASSATQHALPAAAKEASRHMGRRKRAAAAAVDNDTDEPMPPASSKRAKQTKVQKDAKSAVVPAANVAARKGKAAVVERAAATQPQGGSDVTASPAFYLIKSEPHEFSIDDLEQKPSSTGEWDGVRSAQARNIMMSMKVGDLAFYYHSNTKEPGVVGIVKVVREHYADFTATDKKHKGYDPKSSEDNPKWRMVDVQLVRRTERLIGLKELKQYKEGPLQGMQLFTMSRLSVQRVSSEQWDFILGLEHQSTGAAQAPDQ